jgi:hypothetical protein
MISNAEKMDEENMSGQYGIESDLTLLELSTSSPDASTMSILPSVRSRMKFILD